MSESKTAVRILNATIGISSNRKGLLPSSLSEIKVESLLTDFQRIEKIPYTHGLDGYISVQEEDAAPSYRVENDVVIFRGPFSHLVRRASDARYTLWGNQGFLYRLTLYLLEKRHKIFNLHSCALYDEKRDILYVIIGGAGSGKTVYLLSGLERGFKLFSTETVHFRLKAGQLTWHMGSLVDNVRFGTLIHDFPGYLRGKKLPPRHKIWQKKMALDLSAYSINKETLQNPREVYILFPHIERGVEKTICMPLKDRRRASKNLFDNISQKLAETILLYDRLAVAGLDDAELAQHRLEAVHRLLDHPSIVQTASVLSNPEDCWSPIL